MHLRNHARGDSKGQKVSASEIMTTKEYGIASREAFEIYACSQANWPAPGKRGFGKLVFGAGSGIWHVPKEAWAVKGYLQQLRF